MLRVIEVPRRAVNGLARDPIMLGGLSDLVGSTEIADLRVPQLDLRVSDELRDLFVYHLPPGG